MNTKKLLGKVVTKSLTIFLSFAILLTSFAPFQTPFSPREALAVGSCSEGGTSSSGRPQAKVGGVALDQAATFLADMDDITGTYYDE